MIPQGYSDGYDRGLSNKGFVSIKKRKCRVVGRISMNMIVVDITKLNVFRGDKVYLVDDNVTVKYLAKLLNTIEYEVVSRISPLIPRVVH